MSETDVSNKALNQLLDAGFDKATCVATRREMHELQAENAEISLLRTGVEPGLTVRGIVDEKQAALALNAVDDEAVTGAISELRSMANASEPDPAYDIAESQPSETFKNGIEVPDYDAMYDRLEELHAYARETYPEVNLRATRIVFNKSLSSIRNSNGVDFTAERGYYSVSLQFSSKDGTDTSSMNFTGYSTLDLATPIHESNEVDTLLRQSVEQVRTQHIPAKFTGDLVIAPHCTMNFLGFLIGRIGNAMIDHTSVYEGKLGEQVASNCLTMHSRPLSDELASGYTVTSDGYKADDSTVIDAGVLETYLLTIYGANKMNLARAVNNGGCYIIEPGEQSVDDMIGDVAEGIYINRFSGGRPNDRGDFSGVAKNSYYVKDGKIQYPVKETTVSGNLVQLLHAIEAISSERLNSGASILPWIRASGVTVS